MSSRRVSELRTKNRPIFIIIRLGEKAVQVVGATLISSGEVVSSEFIELSVYYFYIKTQAHSKCYTVTIVVNANVW